MQEKVKIQQIPLAASAKYSNTLHINATRKIRINMYEKQTTSKTSEKLYAFATLTELLS